MEYKGERSLIDTKQTQARLRHMNTAVDNGKKKSAQTAPAAQAPAQARGRAKKEDMAYTLHFVDAEGKESTRIPNAVTGMVIKVGENKVRAFTLSDIPDKVKNQLIIDALRKKANFFLKDAVKGEVGKIQNLATELAKVTSEGTLYAPKEGGGPGRAVDYDFWCDAMARTAELRIAAGNKAVKPMTEKVRAEFRLKLESMTPKEREEKKKKWFQDRVFKNAVMQLRAEKAKLNKDQIAAEEHDALADMF